MIFSCTEPCTDNFLYLVSAPPEKPTRRCEPEEGYLRCSKRFDHRSHSGGVRHDPQRFMDKAVTVPHFNRDTVEFASRKRNESNPGIKTLPPFPKNITEERDFENFQDLIVALDACYWLHKTISRSLSRFGDERAI